MAKRGNQPCLLGGAGLYMCQYMLIIPTLTDVLRRIGVSTGLVGAIAGASDFASMFMTPGAPMLPTLLLPALGLRQAHLMAVPLALHCPPQSLQNRLCLSPGACLHHLHGYSFM